MGDLRSDLRSTLRCILARPWSNLAAMLLLGAAMATFVAVSGLVGLVGSDRPSGIPDAQRLFTVNEGLGRGAALTGEEILGLRRADPGLEGLVALRWTDFNLVDGEGARRESGLQVDGDLFRTLGWPMQLGVGFTAEHFRPGSPTVVVLADRVWRQHFGAAAGIVGRAVRIDGRDAIVVGVLGPRQEFPFQQQLYLNAPIADAAQRASDRWDTLLGIADEDSRQRLAGVVGALGAQRVGKSAEQVLALLPRFAQEATTEARILTWTLYFIASLLVLTAASNAGGLMWVQWFSRHGELAVRAALGASFPRLLRLVLLHAAVVGAGAFACGTLLARLALHALEQDLITSPNGMPPYYTLVVTGSEVLLSFVAAGLAVLVVCLPTAWRLRSLDLHSGVRQGAAGGTARVSRISRGFVAMQLCIAAMAVVVATMTALGVQQTLLRSPGFEIHSLAMAGFDSTDAGAQAAFGPALVARLRERPEVVAATLGNTIPNDDVAGVSGEMRVGERSERFARFDVDPQFADVFGLRLAQGRWLTQADHATGADVAVIDRRVAQALFAEGAVGRTFAVRKSDGERVLTIVGVVEALGRPYRWGQVGAVYLPQADHAAGAATVVARLREGIDADAFAQQLAAIGRSVDPDMSLSDAGSYAAWRWTQSRGERFVLALFAPIGLFALMLAAIGASALLGVLVSLRVRELALRRALGAGKRALARSALAGLAGFAAIGVALGTLFGALLGGQLAGQLYGDAQLVMPAVAIMPLLLMLALAVASAPQLRRAVGTDPARVLRGD